MSSSSRSKYRSIETIAGPALWPTIGWIALAVFAQATLGGLFAFRGAIPALVMIPVGRYAMRMGARRGAIAGCVAGLLDDIFGSASGNWTIATTLAALGIGTLGRSFFSDGFVTQGVLVALAVMARNLLFWGLERLEGFPHGLGTVHFHTAVVQALLTGALTTAYLVARGRFVVDRTRIERYP
ncbi:MAG: rod shape-determining protein MreD [Candidatus Velthaea sp.]